MNADVARLVEQAAAEAEATRDQATPAGAVPSRPNKSVPVAVRLAPEDVAAIEALAGKLDVPISSLLRGWILEALNSRREESVGAALDRLSADVARLRELVA